MDLFSKLDSQQINTILDKVTKHFSKEPTYSLRIIIEWLSSKNIPYIFSSFRKCLNRQTRMKLAKNSHPCPFKRN